MPRIDTIKLRAVDPAAQQRFYVDVLGMAVRDDGAVSYGPAEAGLMFTPAQQPYAPTSGDIYWKIAIAVPNIDLAHAQLTARGISVGAPRQFKDIGYLAHFQDPEGFTIELIEHWFKGGRPDGQEDRSCLGGGPCLNLLTLRAHEIAPLRAACLNWGMTPLSIQPVDSHGFTLHFFAFTDDIPPNADLISVENREWLYQRPYTVLEIQHVHDGSIMIAPEPEAAGYVETLFTHMDQAVADNPLRILAT